MARAPATQDDCCISMAIPSQVRGADAAPRIPGFFVAGVVRHRAGRRRRRCDRPQRQVPEQIEHISQPDRRQRSFGSPGPDLMLGWTSPLPDDARSLLATEAAAATGATADRAGRRHRQGRRTEARSDPGLRHRLAALCGSCQCDAAAHRRAYLAVGWVAGGNPQRVPLARQYSASGRARGNPGQVQPKHCLRCRRTPDRASACCLRAWRRMAWPSSHRGPTSPKPSPVLGWQVVAPPGEGPSRQASFDDIRALDPDVIVFTDPAMRATLAAFRSVAVAARGSRGACVRGTQPAVRLA